MIGERNLPLSVAHCIVLMRWVRERVAQYKIEIAAEEDMDRRTMLRVELDIGQEILQSLVDTCYPPPSF